MIHSLDYSVTFPSTGKRFASAIDFKTGLTAITGPNEAGKSLVLEMIRFGLYGSAALRGPAADYKTLKITLEVTIKGERYRIERAINKAKLFRGPLEIASGVTPVNQKIVELMGFGLAVFDVACVANQSDVERLGAMKPAERKRMVDSVIGLGVIEDLAKWAQEEHVAQKRLAAELTERLVEPEAPERPEGYRPAAELEVEVADLKRDEAAYHKLQGLLSVEKTAPEAPQCEVSTPLPVLEMAMAQYRATDTEWHKLNARLKALPAPPEHSLADLDAAQALWDAAELWAERQAFLRATPMPEKTADEISFMYAVLELHEKCLEYERQRKFVEQLEAQGEHVCPECDHHWPVAGEDLEAARAKLVKPAVEVATPDFTKRDVDAAHAALEAWEARAAEWAKYADLERPETPSLTASQIRDQRVAHEAQATRKELAAGMKKAVAILQKLEAIPDQLEKRRTFEADMARHARLVAEFEVWVKERRKQQAESDRLEKTIEDRRDLPQLHALARTYESLCERYEALMVQHARMVEEIEAIRAEARQWQLTRDALMRVRSLVKQHLVPSLNRVASWLISEMTGGRRTEIAVDEEFNILVDGQGLDTLSGSGKAVANLALRLALGQVLTQGVFPVFMADEIDASMDADRAGNTTEVLRTLADRISQVFLVTHKFPEADFYVETGNAGDEWSDGGVKATFRAERGVSSRERAQGRVSMHFREDA